MTVDAPHALIDDLVDQIKTILAGRPPEVQGAVNAQLLAIWLAGFPKKHRPRLKELQDEAVEELVQVIDGVFDGHHR